MAPKVTVLLPVYNGSRYLGETIAALLRQTWRDFALVVCDNASTDDSVAIACRFDDPRLRVWDAREHVPLIANFNRARTAVESEYFAWCSYDESYEPAWLGALVALLDREPRAFAAICKADSIDGDGRVYLANAERYKDTFWPPEEPCVFEPRRQARDLVRGNFPVLTTCLFRTEATEAIGPLSEELYTVADWEYWFRGIFAGWTMVGTHRRLVHYRRHDQMTTRRSNAELTRFRQELELLDRVAPEGHARGFFETDRPDHRLVRNTSLDEFARLLAAGDREGAANLHGFLRGSVPGIAGSPIDHALGVALRAGRVGGMTLRALEVAYLQLHTLAHARRSRR